MLGMETDSELIAATLAGDQHAFEKLVERYLKAVYNFVLRLSGSAIDTDDAVQNTFLNAWSGLSSFKPGGSAKQWLFAIARNAIMDMLRKRRDIPFSVFEDDEGTNPIADAMTDVAPLPEEVLIRAEQHNTVQALLRELPLSQREILLLHSVEYMTFAEIGQVLGQSVNTVKSRHLRGIRLLRKLLVEKHQNDGSARST